MWCVVKCGSKNRHQEVMCLKEVGKCAQNDDLTILGLIISINVVVGGYLVILWLQYF